MKTLVTGGFGLIGSAIVNSLTVPTVVLSRTDKNRERVTRDVEVLLKDICDITKEDLVDVDTVYHCAGTVDNYNVLTDPFIDVKTNLNGTTALLEACKDLEKKPKIIYLSTFFVYGNVYDTYGKPITEESPTDPLAIYPATKLCAESVIKLYSKLYKIPYLICRLTNVYGDEGAGNKKKGIISYFIYEAFAQRDIKLYKGGNFLRDYIYIDDVVSALTFLNEHAENDTFLVGYGTPVKFKDLLDCVLEATDSDSLVTNVEPPDFHKIVGIGNFVADTSKLKALGWKPKCDYKVGIYSIVTDIMIKDYPTRPQIYE